MAQADSLKEIPWDLVIIDEAHRLRKFRQAESKTADALHMAFKDSKKILLTATPIIGNVNPIRYRGYYFDRETGLYFLGSRYYDPEIGRFISPDSIEYLDPESINGLNLYTYCLNNPVMLIKRGNKKI